MQLRGSLRALVLLGAALVPAAGSAQVVDADARATVFVEPSNSSKLLVVHPGVRAAARVSETAKVSVGYDADIVTGATESIKGGPLGGVDVVSSATSFDDVRHVGHAGFSLERRTTRLSGGYAYGTESDYRSHSFSVSAGTDFNQKNTSLDLSYARGFDEVCTSAFSDTLPTSSRVPLDSSRGCFTSAAEEDGRRATRDVFLDNFQVAWTQSWTPVLTTQLLFTGQLQNGFLENPYRAVVIAPSGASALEHHPENRARASLTLRTKYFVRSWQAALGANARVYRDTWDMLAGTYELSLEKHWTPWLRLLGRARFHQQSGVLFWSDDYTGGEPLTGPRGQYWTGDRELSPLNSYSLGARALVTSHATGGQRLLGIFLYGSAGASFDVIKTDLREFTWAGVTPDDTLAGVLTLTLSGSL